MTIDKQRNVLESSSIEHTERDRKPYTPPRIAEEALIENLAMTCTNLTGKTGCTAQTT